MLQRVKSIDVHYFQWIIFVLSGFALSASYFMQYYLHLIPCDLCFYARQVWKMACVFALLGALMPPVNNVPRVNMVFYYITMFWLTFSLSIAIAHVGIERHWWIDFVQSCNIDLSEMTGINPTLVKSCADADYVNVFQYTIPYSVTMLSFFYALFAFCLGVFWRVFNSCRKLIKSNIPG